MALDRLKGAARRFITFEVVHRLRDEFKGVGVAVQAYLYRSQRDPRVSLLHAAAG